VKNYEKPKCKSLSCKSQMHRYKYFSYILVFTFNIRQKVLLILADFLTMPGIFPLNLGLYKRGIRGRPELAPDP